MKKSLHLLLFLFYINSISAKLHKDCITTTVVTVDAAAIITGNSSVCVGATSQLTGTGTPATTNPWISSDTSVATIGITGLVTGVSAGTATITYTDSSGGSATVIVNINALPFITGTLAVCKGYVVQLTSSSVPSPALAWSSSNPAVATVSNTGLITGISPGTVTVTYTNANGCNTTAVLIVNPLPTPVQQSAPYKVCDNNQDGYNVFNLNTMTSGIANGQNYTMTYHETLANAQSGVNLLTSPYSNKSPFVQVIYAAAVDNVTGCRSVVTVELNVEPGLVMPSLPNLTNCDLDSNTQDQMTYFDFTSQKNFILAAQSNPGTYNMTFYEDVNLTVPIISIINYPGSDNQTIWVTIKDTAHACTSVGSFQLFVIAPLTLTFPTPLNVCDNDAGPNDEYHVFDLTVKDAEINQGTGYQVTYYPSLFYAQNDIYPINNPTAYVNEKPGVQTLGVAVINPSGCKSITPLDIRVLSLPTPLTNPPMLPERCDYNNPGDMMEVFDLTYNEAYISGGDPSLTFHYYFTQMDALAETNEIITPSAALVGQNVWIRVETLNVDYQGNSCFVLVEQPLKVNPLPVIEDPLPPHHACDTDADGFMFFDLISPTLAASILGPNQLPSDFTISYYETAAGANPDTNTGEAPLSASYNNTIPNSQNIYVRVVNNTTGCANPFGVLTLVVEQAAFAAGPQIFKDCDNYDNLSDGINQVDFTQFSSAILNGQNPTVFLLSYYHTQADADAGINKISDPVNYVTAADTDRVWVKVENSSNLIVPACYALTTIDITTERRPNAVVTVSKSTICMGDSVEVTFSGTPGATIGYSINGGIEQIAQLGDTGTYTLTDSPTSNTSYTLLEVQMLDSLICEQSYNNVLVNVEVNPCITISDPNFEQALVDLGYDTVMDGKVMISDISGITSLDLSNKNINDLKGLEMFTNLTSLNLANNNLTSLNFGLSDAGKNSSGNAFASLQTLNCSGNQLTSLDISGLTSLQNLDCSGNPGLTCITVKDVAAAELNTNWIKDATAIYSTSCSKLAIDTPSLNNFRVTAYPNPSKNGFVMDVNTLSQEVLRIKVYDMLGKLIDQMDVNPNMISSQRIGQNYSSGIYNIIVTQENEIQTLRVIKE